MHQVLLESLCLQLRKTQDLSDTQVVEAAEALASAELAEASKAEFLLALADKGETAEEIAAFARAFRAKALDPEVSSFAPHAIDIVGTGGDHAGGFNISSLVVLLLACEGVPVMKHGNRGITSKCGSADLLAALGFDIQAPPERLKAALATLGYTFFFAPSFHPSFRHIAPVRRLLASQGRRTVFNVLGPLLNPGRPAHLLLGCFSEAWVPKLAAALTALGAQSGLVVHGRLDNLRGIDELTSATLNRVVGVGRLKSLDALWSAEDFGLAPASFADLAGGDLAYNLAVVEALLKGQGPRGLEDTVVLNAALALWILGREPEVKSALPRLRERLLGGEVRRKIEASKDFFAC